MFWPMGYQEAQLHHALVSCPCLGLDFALCSHTQMHDRANVIIRNLCQSLTVSSGRVCLHLQLVEFCQNLQPAQVGLWASSLVWQLCSYSRLCFSVNGLIPSLAVPSWCHTAIGSTSGGGHFTDTTGS